MVLFKTCPRCHGDVYLTRDIYGSYKKCLQCGYLQDLEVQGPDRSAIEEEHKAA